MIVKFDHIGAGLTVECSCDSRFPGSATVPVASGAGAGGAASGFTCSTGAGAGSCGIALVLVSLYRQHQGDRIVAEINNGGEMVEATLRMVDANCHLPPCTPREAKSSAPNRSPRSTSRAGSAEKLQEIWQPIRKR